MKVAINRCFGGFGLSDAAYERLIQLGIPRKEYTGDSVYNDIAVYDDELAKPKYKIHLGSRYWESWTDKQENRNHPLLIQVIEELGKKADGNHASLVIRDIPDGVNFEIHDYDGQESIHEVHRSW